MAVTMRYPVSRLQGNRGGLFKMVSTDVEVHPRFGPDFGLKIEPTFESYGCGHPAGKEAAIVTFNPPESQDAYFQIR